MLCKIHISINIKYKQYVYGIFRINILYKYCIDAKYTGQLNMYARVGQDSGGVTLIRLALE